MVSFSHKVSKLSRSGDGTTWGSMEIDLPFEVETSFYDEDVIPGFDLFMCDEGMFLHLQLVSSDRKKKELKKPLAGVRVIPSRYRSQNSYNTPTRSRETHQRSEQNAQGNGFASMPGNQRRNANVSGNNQQASNTNPPQQQPNPPQQQPNPPPEPLRNNNLPPTKPPPQNVPGSLIRPQNTVMAPAAPDQFKSPNKRRRENSGENNSAETHINNNINNNGPLPQIMDIYKQQTTSEYDDDDDGNNSLFSLTYNNKKKTKTPYNFAHDCPAAAMTMVELTNTGGGDIECGLMDVDL